MPGGFIVLEGPDGSGTTTQTFLLAERLRNHGIDLIHTEEPTEGQHGRRIREALRGSAEPVPPVSASVSAGPSPDGRPSRDGSGVEGLTTGGKEKLEPTEMQRIFCEDRREHVERVIAPAIHSGLLVLCDRYIPSTMVYGEAGGVQQELLTEWNQGFPKPDLTIVTLPPFATSWERILERGVQDAFEREPFQRKVHEGYERYCREHPEAKVVDTSRRVEQSAEEIWEIVKEFLKLY
jgi:dTMP kinase